MTRALPPATRSLDLRDHLPALEPDRTVTDWGRSERLEGTVDATVVTFLYRHWFRCSAEGVEHVPAAGGALLVAEHAGALTPAASLIARALREEHPRPRPLHVTVDHGVTGYPFLGMLAAKVGGVPAHPANVHRLLFDEQQLVLGGDAGAAFRAGVPIVPVAVAGAAQALPAIVRRGVLQLGAACLPATVVIRFLPPVPTDGRGEEELAADVHARIRAAAVRRA